MGTGALSTAFSVAGADFRQRIRSRRLLVVLAIFAYVGYQLNVGTFELFYHGTAGGETINYRGAPTAAYVGLTTAVTGASVLLFGGYPLLAGSLERDRSTGVDELVASTPVRSRSYLLGKWLSHVALVAVVLATVGGAALVNHFLHGTGPTNPIWICGPVFFVGLPLGCVIAGVTLLFQSTNRLRGTLGTAAYFFGALTVLTATLAATDGSESAPLPLSLRLADTVGLFAAGEMTIDTLRSVSPPYEGVPVANYGTGMIDAEIITFRWAGGPWPDWFYANRLGLVVLGLAFVVAATVPYDRFARGGGTTRRGVVGRSSRLLSSVLSSAVPSVRSRGGDVEPAATDPATVSLTSVTDRSAGGFGRLLAQECKLLLRGRPWWWYAGAAIIVVVGLAGAAPPSAIVSVAAIWPLFLWSGMGYRSIRYRTTPLLVSSSQPYRQLLTEWGAGALVTAAFLGVALWPHILETGLEGAIVLAGAALFVPSIAQALGLWSRTRRAFELGYLVLWYAGPLNGVPPLDFAGATTETVGTAIPVAFGVVGLLALAAALAHRWRQT